MVGEDGRAVPAGCTGGCTRLPGEPGAAGIRGPGRLGGGRSCHTCGAEVTEGTEPAARLKRSPSRSPHGRTARQAAERCGFAWGMRAGRSAAPSVMPSRGWSWRAGALRSCRCSFLRSPPPPASARSRTLICTATEAVRSAPSAAIAAESSGKAFFLCATAASTANLYP